MRITFSTKPLYNTIQIRNMFESYDELNESVDSLW